MINPFIITTFIFGLVAGSFINVLICRLPEGDNFIFGRSRCPKCKHHLAWYDLIPVLSFLMLGAKCRYCKKAVSWQYPLVELLTGFLFAAIFIFGGNNFLLIFFFFLYSIILIPIFVIDFKHYLIPDILVYAGLVLALLYLTLSPIFYLGAMSSNLLLTFISSTLFFFFIAALHFFSKGKAMGFGDVKLALLVGLITGWPNIFVMILTSFLTGAVVGVILMAMSRKTFKSPVPFGPFLILGTYISFFFGQTILEWYLRFIL